MSDWTRIELRREGRASGPPLWRVLAAVVYHVGGLPSPLGWTVTVPAGYVTDLASVPRWLRWTVDRDELAPAAVLHDYLLDVEGLAPEIAHACFYEAALASGCGRSTAAAAWAAVTAWTWLRRS